MSVGEVVACSSPCRSMCCAGLERTPLFSIVRADASYHYEEATAILDDDDRLADRVPWKGPGYSYFLAGLMKLFGRSPGDLREALCQAFGAAKIGAEETLIGIDYRHQREVREVMTLGQHLRADKNLSAAFGGACKGPAHGALQSHAVAVDSRQFVIGKS